MVICEFMSSREAKEVIEVPNGHRYCKRPFAFGKTATDRRGGGEVQGVRSTVRISHASVIRTRGCEGLALQASVAPTVS